MRDRLSTFAEQAGFAVRFDSDVVLAVLVPCLLADGVVGTCTIEKSYDPTNGKPNDRIGGAVHAVRITADEEHDGRVYHADGNPIESYIDGDGKTWSNISIRKGSQNSPEEDVSASDLIHRYAKQIVGAVSAAGYSETASLGRRGPFKIPNTFEARAAIGSVQDRIRDQSIAIIGLGGTGAYVLDLIAKTPVAEIHLLDSDDVDWPQPSCAHRAHLLSRRLSRVTMGACAKWTTTIPSMSPYGKASTRTLFEWTARPCSPSFCRRIPSTMPSCVSTN